MSDSSDPSVRAFQKCVEACYDFSIAASRITFHPIQKAKMSEQIDLDRDDDNAEDDLQAQWIIAEGQRIARARRRQYFDVAAGLVMGAVIIVLICAILSAGMR